MRDDAGIRRRLLSSIGLGSALIAGPVMAEDAEVGASVDEVVVTGYVAKGLTTPQHVLPVVDTPQSTTIVPDKLLAEQGRRTLRDSMRNITGISFQAGEGNPPGGGDSFSVRGFSARDDIYVDGVRDPGNYFRDPFYAERIEVTKGPASAFAGRGNVGGSVNIVTRSPTLSQRSAAELSIGTADLFRGTADVNMVLSEAAGVALRINAMAHSADEPGRDHVRNKRWAFAPSLAIGLERDTTLTLTYLHLEQDDRPDLGIPNARNFSLLNSGFAGRPAPVDRSNFYGYSTDYRDVKTDMGTARLTHRFNDAVSFRSQARYARVHNDQIASAPRFVGNVTTLGPATLAVGNFKPRDQVDKLAVLQNDLTVVFGGEAMRHTLVAGFEIVDESSHNRRRLDANGPSTNLFDPVYQAAQTLAYNGTRARLDTETVSAYLFDTVELGEQFRIVAGLRYDDADTRVRGFDDNRIAPGFVTDLKGSDREWSGNAALVYKPTPDSSLYVAYGTAFEPSGRAEIVQLAGGNNSAPTTAAAFDVDPETTRSFEVGAKADVAGGLLSLAAAAFQIERDNARTPGVNPGDPAVVLDGEQRVRGFELQAVGAPVEGWNVFAGYTYLSGKVTKSNIALEVGQRLDNTPRHSAVIWTSYDLTPELTLGGGVQYVGKRRSDVRASATGNITIEVKDYAVLDAFAEYKLTPAMKVRLNLYNLGNTRYFQSFSSGQSIPSASRSAVLSLAVAY
ncbi:MAG: TonB-dependent siderophore receptor [Phenylobacterium sp.]|nr:TonB-dependent siderophore receptor [Phenylobacterium sp.]